MTNKVVDRLKKISKRAPDAAVILGSGVDVLKELERLSTYSYEDIFGINPSVLGHSGSLEIGILKGKLVAVLRGRFHLYEGHSWETVTLPTHSLAEWGVPHLYLTNAAGGLSTNLAVGDLMLVTGYRDHLNPKWKESGALPAIFAPTSNAENALSEHVWAKAQVRIVGNSIPVSELKRGVYLGVLGPCYETLAEVEMFRQLGANAVGMSTIPEMEAAKKSNMLAVAISVITNSWCEAKIHSHLEVVEAAKMASIRLDRILRAAILA